MICVSFSSFFSSLFFNPFISSFLSLLSLFSSFSSLPDSTSALPGLYLSLLLVFFKKMDKAFRDSS